MTYTVLAVCTGNICRSPAMERLLAHALQQAEGVEVISGGTHAHDGEDMQPAMKQRVADYGAEVEDFRADQVTGAMIRRADLIVAATAVHVEDMAAEVPEARQRMFTLMELGRLIGELDADTVHRHAGTDSAGPALLGALVEHASQVRVGSGVTSTSEEDVVDPYMMPADVYDASFDQIREPVEALAGFLRLR